MGTSGAYGGSQRQSWERARRQFDHLLQDDTGTSIGDLVQAIADALVDEDPSALVPSDDEEDIVPVSGPLSNIQREMNFLSGPRRMLPASQSEPISIHL